MSKQNNKEAKERADIFVAKFRALVALHDEIVEARETVQQFSVHGEGMGTESLQDNLIVERGEELKLLESQLNANIEELDTLIVELNLETPMFKDYILPKMNGLTRTHHKVHDALAQNELEAALLDRDKPQSSEQLKEEIIILLRKNIKRIFSV